MSANDWAVYRQDFTGNQFLVEQSLSEARARQLVIEYESHKHHQHYWACHAPPVQTDYRVMLKEMLDSGSSLEMALPVLKNQGASLDQCFDAAKQTRNLSLIEFKHAVQGLDAFAELSDALNQLVDNSGFDNTNEKQ